MLTIQGFGLATGVGASRAATDVALAGKTPTVRGHRSFFNDAFAPALCVFESRDRLGHFAERVCVLAQRALVDCLNTAKTPLNGPLALHLVLPSSGPGLDAAAITTATQDISLQVRDRFGPRLTSVVPVANGQAGLGHAIAACAESGVPNHLIIAADSYDDRARMDGALDAKALMSKENPWGQIPGEAAGALWLSQSEAGGQGVVMGVGLATEAVIETSEEDTDFAALSLAVRAACQDMGERCATAWFSGNNNSRYRASELAHAVLRATPFWLAPDLEPDHPALTLGDCGAAAGLTALHLALQRGGDSIISLSAPSGERAALWVAAAMGNTL